MRRGTLLEDNKKEFRESLGSCEAGCTMGGETLQDITSGHQDIKVERCLVLKLRILCATFASLWNEAIEILLKLVQGYWILAPVASGLCKSVNETWGWIHIFPEYLYGCWLPLNLVQICMEPWNGWWRIISLPMPKLFHLLPGAGKFSHIQWNISISTVDLFKNLHWRYQLAIVSMLTG